MSGLRDALRAAADAIADALEAPREAGDEIIPLESGALARIGLEERPIRRLAETGRLEYRVVGRRRVTTRRWLVAALEALPARVAADSDDDLAAAARKRATRIGGASR